MRIYDNFFSETFSFNDFLRCLSGFESLKKLHYYRYHFTWDTFYNELRAGMSEPPLADKWRMSLNSHCPHHLIWNVQIVNHTRCTLANATIVPHVLSSLRIDTNKHKTKSNPIGMRSETMERKYPKCIVYRVSWKFCVIFKELWKIEKKLK